MPYSYPQPVDRRRAPQVIRHLAPGALALAGTAGYINSVVLGFFHTPVSHMTGAVSHLGLDLAAGQFGDSQASLMIIGGYLAGALLAGLMVGARKLVPSRRYGFALFMEGLLLAVAAALFSVRHRLGLPVVALACGLQNAMSSSYCGLAIRTTHVTGLVTDVGEMLGHWVRHREVDWFKLRFLVALFLAFGVGGFIGAFADQRFGVRALLPAAVGCSVAGIALWVLIDRGYLRLATDQLLDKDEPDPPSTGAR